MKALSIRSLKKVYKNGVEAVKEIDLDVDRGDFFALLGPNGAGKTTTIGIVTSLVNKTAGKIMVFGHDVDTNFSKAKSYIGLVPQEFNFPMFDKVIHVLVNQAGYYGISRRQAYQQAEKYLKRLSLWDRKNSIACDLSGGLKRRLMIARALIHEPKLLILDEPTTGVDIELRRATWDFLQEINRQGTTIILTTHYLEEVEYLCKQVGIINHGKIIENTNIKRLIKNLDVETFVFDLANPIDTTFYIEGFKTRVTDCCTLEADIYKEDSLNTLFNELSKQNIMVKSMKNKVNRLEELFLRITRKRSE